MYMHHMCMIFKKNIYKNYCIWIVNRIYTNVHCVYTFTLTFFLFYLSQTHYVRHFEQQKNVYVCELCVAYSVKARIRKLLFLALNYFLLFWIWLFLWLLWLIVFSHDEHSHSLGDRERNESPTINHPMLKCSSFFDGWLVDLGSRINFFL